MAQAHFWRKEQIEFLKEHYPSNTRKKLTELVNQTFGLNITENQITSALSRNNIKSGRDGRFEKGHEHSLGNRSSLYKRGSQVYNHKPIGHERAGKGGYIYIKVSEEGKWSDRWKMKHIVIWEKVHGKIPDKHCLLFLDGDKNNITLENLQLITREQLAILNKKQLLSNERELNEAAVNVAKVFSKINEINRRKTK